MQGYYHSIEHFGTVDGQGIRYVLFLSGCQLRCRFCHNPDTWQQGSQLISTEEILKDIRHYRHFYAGSGGGITVSGGEPLLQSQFVAELFAACQNYNIHTTIDTAGYYNKEHLTNVLPYTNAALFSIKAVDPQKHQWLAGFGNQQILDNLNYLVQHIPVTLRYVVIPGLTNSVEDLQALAGLVHSLSAIVPIELLPYHSLGRYKWQTLNMKYTLDDVPDATHHDISLAASILKAEGITLL
jgi:pyruvate formate lyase activating enzyme